MSFIERFLKKSGVYIKDSTNTVVVKNQGSGSLSVNVDQTKNEYPPDLVEVLRKQGLAKEAIDRFFSILEVSHVPEHEWKSTLEEMAVRHLELLERLNFLESDNPNTKNLREKAQEYINKADFFQAEKAINEIKDIHQESAKISKEKLARASDAYEKQILAYQEEQLAAAEAVSYNAELMRNQFKYNEAAQYYKSSIKIAEDLFEVCGESFSPHLSVFLANAANNYQESSDYGKAENLYLRSLNILEGSDSELKKELACIVNNSLAELYRRKGDFKKSEALYMKALSFLEKNVNSTSHLLPAVYNNLSQIHLIKGEYQKSRDNLCKALRIYRSKYGVESVDVAYAINNISNFYTTVGNYKKAKALLEKSIKLKEVFLGKNHISTITSMGNLARIEHLLKNYNQASLIFEDAKTVLKEIKLDKHPLMAVLLTNHASLYYELDEMAIAKKLYLEALEIIDKEDTQEPELSSILNNLALIYRDEKNFDVSIKYFFRSLFFKEKTIGLSHPETFSTLNGLLTTLNHTKDHVTEKKLYFSFYRKYRKAFGKKNTATGTLLNNLGVVYKLQGEYEKAAKIFLRAAEIKKEAVGINHYININTFNNLAETYHVLKNHVESEKYYLCALKVTEDIFGREDYRYISCFNKYKLLKSGGNLEPEVFSILSKDITCDANLKEINLIEDRIRNSCRFLVNDSSRCIGFGNDNFYALIFFQKKEESFLDFRVKNGYEIFPGLITSDKDIRVGVRLEKAKNCIIDNCFISGCYAIGLDNSSSVVLANHKHCIDTKELGHLEYSIDFGLIVGMPNDGKSFDLIDAFDELISHYIEFKR